MYDPYNEFTKHVLSNGLEVHSVFWDRPWIGVEVVIHAGGREDPTECPGTAHFVEHLVSQNIPNRTIDQAKEFFEICGGYANFGSTEYLATRYDFGVSSEIETFREALNIFGSMLLEARLVRDVERERRVIFREFNMKYPFIERLDWDMSINKAIFKNHRLETWNRPLGRPEGFLSITENDLQAFYDKYYVPENISLVIVGGIQTDQVLAELEESSFGIKKEGKRNSIPQPFINFQVPTEQLTNVSLADYVSFKVDQTEYRASWAFPYEFPNQTRRVFTIVLNKILFEEIREKRSLAYSIRASYIDFQDVYKFAIKGLINPTATPYIDDLVRKCISMVSKRQDLFDRVLMSLKNSCRMVDLSGQDLADDSANDLVTDHRIILAQEILDDLNKVKFEQMQEVVELLYPLHQHTLIIRP